MCGVVGVYEGNGKPPDGRILLAMREALAHRGPDGKGLYLDGQIGLGHRRLAIIDLSAAADQPMQSADGNLVIAYNGEVYNFRELRAEIEKTGWVFRTRSDTE